MDHHVPYAITHGLRLRGVDVLTAEEDGTARFPDPELLDRATALDRLLFTQDDDLIREAVQRQRSGQSSMGVIYTHQHNLGIGECIDRLELIAQAGRTDEF